MRIIGLLSLLLVGCQVAPSLEQKLPIQVVSHEEAMLTLQTGMKSQVHQQPLLIDHPFDMGMALSLQGGMGVALAAGIHRGKTEKVLDDLKGMPPLDLKLPIQQWLQSRDVPLPVVIEKLHSDKQQWQLMAYAELYGYPDATLKLWLQTTLLNDDDQVVFEKSYEHQVVEKPLFGEGSWTSEAGKPIHEASHANLPSLLKRAALELQQRGE